MPDLRLDKVARIEAMIEARYAGDIALMLSGFSPDARLRFVGHVMSSPFHGIWHGSAAITAAMHRFGEAYAFADLAIDDVLVDRDRAAIRYTVLVTSRETGHRFELESMAHLVFRAGLVVSYSEFADTGLFLAPPIAVRADFVDDGPVLARVAGHSGTPPHELS